MLNVLRSLASGFNPRSREGSDGSVDRRVRESYCFNPRSREGSDQGFRKQEFKLTGFNPRSREGSDTNPDGIEVAQAWFQSTLPRGERHLK